MNITYTVNEERGREWQEPDLSEVVAQIKEVPIETWQPTESETCALDEQYSNAVAQELHYMENFTKKTLSCIAEYYSLPTKKYSKSDVATAIVLYEAQTDNQERVAARHGCWAAMETLRNDPRMRKYVLLDVI